MYIFKTIITTTELITYSRVPIGKYKTNTAWRTRMHTVLLPGSHY